MIFTILRKLRKAVDPVPALTLGLLLSGACLANSTPSMAADSHAAAKPDLAVSPAVLPNDTFSINSGGGATSGYDADAYFNLGSVYSNTSQPVSTASATYPAPAAVYSTEREGSHFSYTFSGFTPTQGYIVILHFAELYWTLPHQREFNVAINGTSELTNFDIVEVTGGPFRAIDELFFVRADANGKIEIDFTKGAVDQPLVNAIEIRSNAG